MNVENTVAIGTIEQKKKSRGCGREKYTRYKQASASDGASAKRHKVHVGQRVSNTLKRTCTVAQSYRGSSRHGRDLPEITCRGDRFRRRLLARLPRQPLLSIGLATMPTSISSKDDSRHGESINKARPSNRYRRDRALA